MQSTYLVTERAHVVLVSEVRLKSIRILELLSAQIAGQLIAHSTQCWQGWWTLRSLERWVHKVRRRMIVPFVALVVFESRYVLHERAAGALDAVTLRKRMVAEQIDRSEGGTAKAGRIHGGKTRRQWMLDMRWRKGLRSSEMAL